MKTMKKTKTVYQQLTKKLQAHVRECFDAPASKISISRIKYTLKRYSMPGGTLLTFSDKTKQPIFIPVWSPMISTKVTRKYAADGLRLVRKVSI